LQFAAVDAAMDGGDDCRPIRSIGRLVNKLKDTVEGQMYAVDTLQRW